MLPEPPPRSSLAASPPPDRQPAPGCPLKENKLQQPTRRQTPGPVQHRFGRTRASGSALSFLRRSEPYLEFNAPGRADKQKGGGPAVSQGTADPWGCGGTCFFPDRRPASSWSGSPSGKAKHCPEAAVVVIWRAAPFWGPFGFLKGVALAVSCLTAEVRDGPTAEQRAVNPLAQFLQRHFAQPKQFAMQNGKGVKEGESDELDP